MAFAKILMTCLVAVVAVNREKKNNILKAYGEAYVVPLDSWLGDYKDPNHNGAVRNIRLSDEGDSLLVSGQDDPKGPKWSLIAQPAKNNKVLKVDFSPKGGPKDLEGEITEEGIRWPDGNEWTTVDASEDDASPA